jgi:hypothetical protein
MIPSKYYKPNENVKQFAKNLLEFTLKYREPLEVNSDILYNNYQN